MYKTCIYRALTAITLGIAVFGCSSDSGTALRVGLSIWPPNEMAYLADERSLFGNSDVELIDTGSPSEYLPSYSSGGYDIVAVSLGSALELASIDDSHRIIMLLDYSDGGDALVAQSDYRTGADLKGKRIGYEASALSVYMLSRYLTLIGLRLEDIVAVPMDYVVQERAFLNGDVDAVATWEPQVARLVGAGGNLIIDSRATPKEGMDVLVVREPVLVAKRAQIRAFVNGWFDALQLHNSDPALAGELAEARNHVSKENYRRSFENIVMLDRGDNLRLFDQDRDQLIESLNRHLEFLVKIGLVRDDIDISVILDTSVINEPE